MKTETMSVAEWAARVEAFKRAPAVKVFVEDEGQKILDVVDELRELSQRRKWGKD